MALTEVDDLVVRIEDDPDNIVLAAMLVDELVEARGMYRWEAMLHVQRVQTSGRDARDIAWTTHLLRAKGPAFDALVSRLQSALAIVTGETMTLFVVAGDAEPAVCIPPDQAGLGQIARGYPVSLPAGWVRAWHLRWSYLERSQGKAIPPHGWVSPPTRRVKSRKPR